jgi:transcriptional regulator with XRE-family HTH domain
MIQPALGKTFHEHVIPQFVAARKKKKISQLEMDEILGVAKGLVSKWEVGIRKPSGYLFCCWADALGYQINLVEKKCL